MAKKLETSSTPSKDNSALSDPSTVSVIGAVDDQGTAKSPTFVEPPGKKLRKLLLPSQRLNLRASRPRTLELQNSTRSGLTDLIT